MSKEATELTALDKMLNDPNLETEPCLDVLPNVVEEVKENYDTIYYLCSENAEDSDCIISEQTTKLDISEKFCEKYDRTAELVQRINDTISQNGITSEYVLDLLEELAKQLYDISKQHSVRSNGSTILRTAWAIIRFVLENRRKNAGDNTEKFIATCDTIFDTFLENEIERSGLFRYARNQIAEKGVIALDEQSLQHGGDWSTLVKELNDVVTLVAYYIVADESKAKDIFDYYGGSSFRSYFFATDNQRALPQAKEEWNIETLRLIKYMTIIFANAFNQSLPEYIASYCLAMYEKGLQSGSLKYCKLAFYELSNFQMEMIAKNNEHKDIILACYNRLKADYAARLKEKAAKEFGEI